jgi:hypothetical protein
MTLFQPVGDAERDHGRPAQKAFGGLRQLNGDFFNAIDPKQTSQLQATDWAVAKPCT